MLLYPRHLHTSTTSRENRQLSRLSTRFTPKQVLQFQSCTWRSGFKIYPWRTGTSGLSRCDPSPCWIYDLPRGWALSEDFWSPNASKTGHFIQRVENQFDRSDVEGVNYSTCNLRSIINIIGKAGKTTVSMDSEVPGLDIFLTIDGAMPNKYTRNIPNLWTTWRTCYTESGNLRMETNRTFDHIKTGRAEKRDN